MGPSCISKTRSPANDWKEGSTRSSTASAGNMPLSPLAGDDALARIAPRPARKASRRFSATISEGHDFSHRLSRQVHWRTAYRQHVYGAQKISFRTFRFNSVTTVNGEAFYDWNSEEQSRKQRCGAGWTAPVTGRHPHTALAEARASVSSFHRMIRSTLRRTSADGRPRSTNPSGLR